MSEEKIKNKTIKICLAGDNHGHKELIQKIIKDNPDCDYYFHTGDSMLEEEDIYPFESVNGNCDEMFDYLDERLYELCGHKILLFHGTNQAAFDIAFLYIYFFYCFVIHNTILSFFDIINYI